MGTYHLLEACRRVWGADHLAHRFHHVSTDEVYGSLGPQGEFTESHPYNPSSPYSASKAASDMLVLAYHHTYGLPIVITNCSNNYGPRQFPEKLILESNSGRLIVFVKDRPGHDRRYAIDTSKIAGELEWTPACAFEQGIRQTVRWYLDHQDWVRAARQS